MALRPITSMELWLLLGILSYLSYAVCTSIDKYLMNTKYDPLVTNTVKMFFDGITVLIFGLLFFNLEFTSELLYWSLPLGALYALAGILYLKSLKSADAVTVIPFMQSFTILTVFICSIFLFSLTASNYNYIGILLIVTGVYLVLSKDKLKIPKIDRTMFLVTCSVIILTIYILLVKAALYDINPVNLAVMMYFSSASILFGYTVFKNRQKQIFNIKNLKIIPAGFFGGLGTLLLYAALSMGEVSKVYPIAGLQSAFVFIIATIFLKERFYRNRLLGTIIVFAGIYLTSVI